MRPLRALFVNEGSVASGAPLGHPQVEAAIRQGLDGVPGIEAAFCSLPPLGPVARSLTRGVPGLRRHDLDLQALRWHIVQGLRTRRLVRRELERRPADVMHVVSHAIALALVGEMRRLPVVLSVDVPVWETRAMALWRPVGPHTRALMAPSLALERRALASARLVLAWSDWTRRALEQASPAARIVTHHPGLDLRRFTPAVRASRERVRILFVGGRFEQKGGFDLLAALEPLLETKVELDVVTQTPLAGRPGLRVHRLSAGDERLVELYRQADIFCLPSHGDAFPWAVLEAMACGAAIVATGVGGLPELLANGSAGVLVSPHDRGGLRAAVSELVSDEPRRRGLGRAARERCERHYDVRRQTGELVDHMRGLVVDH